MKNKSWFWGVFLILAAGLAIASQLGGFGYLSVWSLLATIALLALIVYSIASRNAFGIFIPIALLYAIYRVPFNLPRISLWILLIAAVLLSMGIEMIFHNQLKNYRNRHWEKDHHIASNFSHSDQVGDDNHPSISASFTESSRYLHASALQSGNFSVSFGSLNVYMDNVALDPAGANIKVDCSFGSMIIYVPNHWTVNEQIHVSIGDAKNETRFYSAENVDSPVLNVYGNVQFGEIKICHL